MKRLILFVCLLLLPCMALSENAVPACQGPVTDLANVLDDSFTMDFQTLDKRYEKNTDGHLYLITRHFLGGKEVQAYTDQLFDNWHLGENDILFMMVIGEESCAVSMGKNAEKFLPQELLFTLLSTHFRDPFLDRQYALAAGELMSEAASAVSSAKGKALSVSGLFGKEQTAEELPSFVEELDALFSGWLEEDSDEEEKAKKEAEKKDKNSGFSFWKTVLIVWLVYFIFFRKDKRKKRKNRRRYNFGHDPRGS